MWRDVSFKIPLKDFLIVTFIQIISCSFLKLEKQSLIFSQEERIFK